MLSWQHANLFPLSHALFYYKLQRRKTKKNQGGSNKQNIFLNINLTISLISKITHFQNSFWPIIFTHFNGLSNTFQKFACLFLHSQFLPPTEINSHPRVISWLMSTWICYAVSSLPVFAPAISAARTAILSPTFLFWWTPTHCERELPSVSAFLSHPNNYPLPCAYANLIPII